MGFQPNLRIAYTIFAELLQPSLIIPADFGNNKTSFRRNGMKENKMKIIVNRDVSLGEPPPQQMECIIDVLEWFIPEYPQFLR